VKGTRDKVLYPPPSLRDTSASGGQEDRGKEQGSRTKEQGLYPPPSLRDTSASGGQEDRGKGQGKGESFCLTVDLFVDYRLGKLLKLVQNNIGVKYVSGN